MSAEKKAQALLDAHVKWIVERLSGADFEQEIAHRLDALLADGRKLKLSEVISNTALHDTVRKYAVDMDLGGRMPALVGDVVRMLHDHPVLAEVSLGDLIPDRHFEEFIDKLLEMKELRSALISEAVSNPLFAQLIAELLYGGVRDYVAETGDLAGRVPGAKSAMKLGKAMMSKTRPELAGALEDRLKQFVKKQSAKSLKASEKFLHEAAEKDVLRDMLLDLWEQNRDRRLGSYRSLITALDTEELFVMLYEYWKHFREHTVFSQAVNAGIDTVLEKFGDSDLTTLLHDIGLTREMMIDDAMRFAPPVIKVLKRKKLLTPLLRYQLAGFYESAAAQKILLS
ncbi:MAG: hypothetical protein ACSHXK_00105 [Oceanococcus sp.]